MNDSVRQINGGGLRERAAPAVPTPHAARGPDATRCALFVLPLTSAVFAASALWSPTDLPGFVVCPFRAVTGLPCPGCGMTRAFCAIGHGDFAGAFGFNVLAPFVFAAALLLWAYALATLLKLDSVRVALERLRPTPRATRVMLAVTLVWWVVRLCFGF
jgi:hypothetical protein